MYRLRSRFFFQAEDGIRGGTVTGVQTCALPIWRRVRRDGDGAQRANDSDGGRCKARDGSIPRPRVRRAHRRGGRSEEHTSELQSQFHLVCRLLLEKKKKKIKIQLHKTTATLTSS